ncbi:hypothetical protein BE22_0059 [Staphylococcus phage vB_SepS_BE22]|nr:hypothetical protein BE22_0059 [Staphylococcus phage vB_SepS_BE22]
MRMCVFCLCLSVRVCCVFGVMFVYCIMFDICWMI